METKDYCPICAESIVFDIPELEHSCIDPDEYDAAAIQALSETETGTAPASSNEALVKLHSIWSSQLATREERVVHGHSEGELAHHLLPIVAHVQSDVGQHANHR